ncbi:MAG TPA: polymer-forming cytoskeletal protein [Candidatus Nitrosopolaris sp.]|nr:polymer-forming cytoskeletal protein [Candidatus Nitrosopolaris sp.]
MIDSSVETLEAPATNGDRESSIAGEPKATVLARDDAVSGRLQIKGGGQVLGSFSGQIDCDGDLFIGPDAHVEADVKSARVTIAGFVKGNIVAVNRLKITNTGRLEGDARVGALVVLEGGVHHGVIRVHPEGVPEAKDTAVIESPRPAQMVTLKTIPNPVGRVRKFWGEFF